MTSGEGTDCKQCLVFLQGPPVSSGVTCNLSDRWVSGVQKSTFYTGILRTISEKKIHTLRLGPFHHLYVKNIFTFDNSVLERF